MAIRLLEPAFLLLLPLVFVLWHWPRREHRDVRAFVLRAVTLALVVLALARPVVVSDASETHLVVVLDASASARATAALEAVRSEVTRADRATLVRIGGGESAPDQDFERTIELAPDGAASPLGEALALAAAEIPAGVPGQVIVLSDGLGTDRAFADGAFALAERGIPASFRALGVSDDGARPLAIEPVGVLRVGHTARVRVRGLGAPSDVELLGANGRLAEATATAEGGRFDALFQFEPPQAGFHPVSVRIGAHELRTTLAIQEPLPVLYVGGRIAGGGDALQRLLGAGFDVRELMESGAGIGEDLDRARGAYEAALATSPLVVLDDAPAQSLPEGFIDSLAAAVRDRGTGLVMSGGSAAFGPGGYADTAIEEVMPVGFVQREEKRDPSTTLVVIIDTSGSMGGERVQLAKETARLAIQRLLPHDKVGIVEFYGAKRWAAPIQPASNHIELERALNRLDAGGGTVILPAIEEAFYGLQNIDTRYKHVLVLTDGGVERGSFEPLIRRMADKGMTVSTVLVGGTLHSEFLVDIANWGKGRFYAVPNRFNLPEVLLKQPTSAQLPAYRTGSYVVDVGGGPVWWGGERPDALPDIAGYTETEARPGAEILVSVRETEQPLVATWMWGAGRTAAFMSEPTGEGTSPWSSWPDYGRFLGRLLAHCAASDEGTFRFSAVRTGHELVLTAAAIDGAYAGDLRPTASTSDGARLDFQSIAPGRFEARRVVAPSDGLELVCGHVLESGTTALTRRLVAPPVVVPEFAVDPADALAFERLARATGGADLAVSAPVAATTRAISRAVAHLAPWAALLALLVHLVDVLLRRLPGSGSTRVPRP